MLKLNTDSQLPQTIISTRFSELDYKILDRHYLKINIFGYVLRIWNTSPHKVLQHLKENERLDSFSKLVSDKPSKFIDKLAEYKKKCICNDISKHQVGGFCCACHTDWL